MPGVSLYSIRTGAVALSASSTKTLWLANPVTNGFVPTQIMVSFDSSSAVVAPAFEFYRVVTIGSAAGSMATVVKYNDPNAHIPTTTGLTSLTAEPTTVEVLEEYYLQPAGGLYVIQYPLGAEPGAVGGGQRLGLRVITQASVTPNVRSTLVFRED